MKVSRRWLAEYVPLEMPLDELTDVLTMSGFNLESAEPVGEDVAIDLEVTSNRPDCLGHLGVAREISTLFAVDYNVPFADVTEIADRTDAVTSVEIECEDLCPQYVARVIRGVKVGPSPAWLVDRLQTVFRKEDKDGKVTDYKSINNIVDITNYVLMECGQPLHAFDFNKLRGKRVVVRRAKTGETLTAINHKEYALTPEMCVIADDQRPVAIGGVMGGKDTEVTEATTDVLIEVANFTPLSIRATARGLKLHSDSSYRFERGINVQQMDWASRRCCELILQLAGGELLAEPVIAGTVPIWQPATIELRFARVEQVLGIKISAEDCCEILGGLGLPMMGKATAESASFRPPPWRRDLTREIDLIEEIARVHGYDQIPEDRPIPVVSGTKSVAIRVREKVCQLLTAAGFDEAMTFSFINDQAASMFPVASGPDLTITPAAWEYGKTMRRSLVPSLLQARRHNERHGNLDAELFEISRVFLGANPADPTTQPVRAAVVSGRSFAEIKGVLSTLVATIAPQATLSCQPSPDREYLAGRGAELLLNGQTWGRIGEIDRDANSTKELKLREPATIAEFDLAVLAAATNLVPKAQSIPEHQALTRDINFLLDEAITWDRLTGIVKASAGALLESITFVEQYRGKHIPAGKKSYVFSMSLRSPERSLTGEEADAVHKAVVTACGAQVGAVLR